MRVWLIAMAGILAATAAEAQDAPAADCRTATVTRPDGQREQRRYCRNANGEYVSAGTRALAAAPLPPRAEVTYKGTYAVSVTQAGPPMRRLDLQSFLRAAGTSRPMEGTLNIVLRFEGANVTGTIGGTGGVTSSRVTGVVRNGVCHLSSDQGTIHEGPCGRSAFSGRIAQNGERTSVSGRFETQAVSVVDIADRDERQAAARAEAAAKDRAEAEAAQQRLAELEARAAAGDVPLMWILGYMYENGKNAALDYAKAARWYRSAATRNYGPAYSSLARMYREGNGVEQSNARAFDNYLACANAPDVKDFYDTRSFCMRLAGLMLYEGIGTIRNQPGGLRWFRTCAARKDDECINWMNEHGAR